MENRNRDREGLDKNRERESSLPGSTSSPGSESQRDKMDRSTRSDQGSQSGSQSSNVGSQSGDRSRSRSDESKIGSPGRSSDLEKNR